MIISLLIQTDKYICKRTTLETRIKAAKNSLSDMGEKYDEKSIHGAGLHHSSCLLEILPKSSSSPWEEAACNETDEPGFELERAFGCCGSCSSQSVIESVCESEDEQLMKLAEHDQNLVNFVLYYE